MKRFLSFGGLVLSVVLPITAMATERDEPSEPLPHDDNVHPEERSAIQLNLVGARVHSVNVPDDLTGRRSFATFGVALLQADIDARQRHFMYHGTLDVIAAGGAYGDGKPTADLAFRGVATAGYFAGDDGGAFARLGAGIDVGGTRGAGRVLIEVPRIEIGSHWMKGPLFLETGPTTSLALVNGVWLGPYARGYGVQPTWGGFAVAQWNGRFLPPARLRIEAVRSEAIGLDDARPLVTARGRLCVGVYGPLALCADGDVTTTSAPVGGPLRELVFARQTATSFGMVLAFGGVSRRGAR